MHVLLNYLYMFGYGIAGAITMSVALALLVRIWTWVTPIHDWDEIKKGNIAAAIVLAAVIVGFSLVVALAIMPT